MRNLREPSFEALVRSHTSSPSDGVTEPRNWVGTNLFIVHRPDDAQTDRRCHRQGHLGGCGHGPAPAHRMQCHQFGHPASFITRAAASSDNSMDTRATGHTQLCSPGPLRCWCTDSTDTLPPLCSTSHSQLAGLSSQICVNS